MDVISVRSNVNTTDYGLTSEIRKSKFGIGCQDHIKKQQQLKIQICTQFWNWHKYRCAICDVFIRLYVRLCMSSSITYYHNYSNLTQLSLRAMVKVSPVFLIRVDSKLAPRQWETSLQSNAVSNWLGANQESPLLIDYACQFMLACVALDILSSRVHQYIFLLSSMHFLGHNRRRQKQDSGQMQHVVS